MYRTEEMDTRPLLIVDAANVVGATPDGWWRDRRGATTRLRDALTPLSARGLDETGGVPVEVVLVVEGKARAVTSTTEVVVVAARSSADDAIVDLVREQAPMRSCWVVTADRELRSRVRAEGGDALGPRTLLEALRKPSP